MFVIAGSVKSAWSRANRPSTPISKNQYYLLLLNAIQYSGNEPFCFPYIDLLIFRLLFAVAALILKSLVKNENLSKQGIQLLKCHHSQRRSPVVQAAYI